MKILLAIDFSRDSKSAIRFLSGLQFPSGSEISLVHIIKGTKELKHLGYSMNLETDLRRIRQKSQKRAIQHLQRLKEKFIDHNRKVHVVVKEGNPGEEMLSLLEKSDMHLAVLGTRGVAGIKRFLLGSVSEWVLHEAPCPVLIVRGPMQPIKGGIRVLLTTDGSTEAQAALEFLNRISFPLDSEIILFHVVEPIDYTVVQDDFKILRLGKEGTENLAHAAQNIQKRVKQSKLPVLK
jgi:nucleotide-binding universal stress UspA family protein